MSLAAQVGASSPSLDKSYGSAQALIKEGEQSQARIDRTISQISTIDNEFRALSQELEQVNTNLAHQQSLHQQQVLKISALSAQLKTIDQTENSIIPILLSAIDWLDTHIEQDLPFHIAERHERIRELKALTLTPDTSLSELYRRVLEAYQIENEFGYNIETYHSTIDLDGMQIEQQILRIGRLGLYFLSLDGSYGGYWDTKQQRWTNTLAHDIKDIEQGIKIAHQRTSPSLLVLPTSLSTQTGKSTQEHAK